LTAINRFPVKSCRGEALDRATIEPWGLAGDRRWQVVDDDGLCITARERPRMLLIRTTLRPDGGLLLSSPDAPELAVDAPSGGARVAVRTHRSPLDATPAGDEAHAWFSKVLDTSVRLVYLDDPTHRHPNPQFARPSDLVSFADAYPYLLACSASLAALNGWIAAGPRAAEGPLRMIRFRPNLVIGGDDEPWAEDGWRRVRVGAAVFRAVKGSDRCAITLTDPDTAVRGKEPIATLARYRKWDGETWFGMNLVPDTPGVEIAVGDPVEVLESVPAPDGPPR
jgi:uncharacterized protein YcbX